MQIILNARELCETDPTERIQNAVDTVFRHGGGEVAIPEGNWEIGTVRLRSNVTLHLLENAHLLGSRETEKYCYCEKSGLEPIAGTDCTDALWEPWNVRKNYDFMSKPMSRWNRGLIRAVDAVNLAIIGENGSLIDGRDCYDELGEEYYRGPHAVNLHRCENILLKGYAVQNSANWAHALFDCRNLRAENITVRAGHDGIHLTSCDNVIIQNCDFRTGDDCVAGIDNRNVEVSGCRLNTACSGMRFGGTNVTVSDCVFYGPASYRFRGSLSAEEKKNSAPSGESGGGMLSAFTYYADFSRPIRETPGNILICNCEFRNTDRFLHYNFSGNEPWQRNKPLDSVVFRNIRAEGIRLPLTFWGAAEQKGNLTLQNIRVSFAKGADCALLYLGNYGTVLLEHLTAEHLGGTCLIRKWTDDGVVRIRDCNCIGFDGVMEESATEPFVCRAF